MSRLNLSPGFSSSRRANKLFSAMEANVTELWQMVESMQGELNEMGTAMDSLWLMLGAILVVCECFHQTLPFEILCATLSSCNAC